jgi:hypothetical protein
VRKLYEQLPAPRIAASSASSDAACSVTTDAKDDIPGYMTAGSGSQQPGLSELDMYLVSDSSVSGDNVMTFWNTRSNVERFPRLRILHLQHHCIQLTSAAMERVFSSAGYIVIARRSRLRLDGLIQDMLVAKCNSELLS